MGYQFSNYATARLATVLDALDAAAVLEAGQGSNFPVPAGSLVFQATIEDTDGNFEIVEVTGRVGDVLTISRAQEATTAQTFPAGSVVELRITAAQLNSFLQKTGGQMQGALDMNSNEVQNATFNNPLITGGRLIGTIFRGSDDGATNQIEVPPGGAAPTLGGNVIFHAGIGGVGSGIDAEFVRGQVPLADTRAILTPADGGLAGGGDFSADRSLTLDITNTVELSAFPVHDDELLINNTDGLRRIDVERIHGISVNEQTTSYTLVRADANKLVEVDSADARVVTVPANASVAFPIGTVIAIRRKGTGAVTIEAAGGVTIESPSGWLSIGLRYGMVSLVKRGLNLWALEGRLDA